MTVKQFSRRGFLKFGTATGAAVWAASQPVHAAGSDVLKIGLVGCGNRGRGSLFDSLTAMPNVRVVALGDLFREKAVLTRDAIAGSDIGRGRIDVSDERIFTGFDSYQGVIAESDIMHIALPSRFHPPYNLAAVQADKHAFTEKPNGVDADGVHVTLEAAKVAEQKKLANVSGLCYRYDLLRVQAIERIRNGEIGEILAAQSDYLRTPYNLIPKDPAWSETEYQIRNWEHFTWLNGDEIQQSLLHNLDSVLWALNDELPETCYALGGRSSVFSPALGDLFDHASVIYEYADGKRIYGATRTAQNCLSSNIDVFHGTKGRLVFNATGIPFLTDTRGNERWRPDPKDRVRSMYVQEHYALINSILEGKPINDGFRMAQSTMVGVLGMIASFTGKRESYRALFESRFKLEPNIDHPSFDMPVASPDADGLYRIPVPGKYHLKTER
ncbi:MAG: Gfo/Idh/MocA family oxidoreductase [Candidatus Anammoximicrobium sp.]|nr:Gfo/Idh/MocA family oxidoreductase [Candidatus Anammoximicrobium sp.]